MNQPNCKLMIIRYLIEKEFKQLLRNPILLPVFLVLPVIMMTVLPRATTQEVKNLHVCIVDHDHSTWSARLVHKLSAFPFFSSTWAASSYREALHHMEAGRADFIIEIGPGFERELVAGRHSRLRIAVNAVNGVQAGLGSSYLMHLVADYAARLQAETEGTSGHGAAGIEVVSRCLYNAGLDYKAFMVPGLMAMLLTLIVGFLPALNIVGEKEKGTIEQINVTPVRRWEFILSKLVPYWCVGGFILAYSMLLARLAFGMVPAGSIGTIFLFATLFTLVVSSLGLMVSNYSDTTRQAALVMFFFLVIFILLGGLLTPVASMPSWAQTLTLANPLRYFIDAMRALYLKGSTLRDLFPLCRALAIYAVIVWTWAIVSYRKH